MLRRLAACAAAVTALAVAPVPRAVAEPGLLEVTGTGATAADVTVASRVSFDLGNAVVTGSGRYAGFALWTTGRSPRPLGGVLASRDLDMPQRPVLLAATTRHAVLAPTQLGGQPVVTLEPGRYRVLLLADGDADVRVPLTPGSTGGLSVRTTRPFRRSYTVAARAVTAADRHVALRGPLTSGRTRRYDVIAQWRPDVPQDVELVACVTRRAASCARAPYATGNTSAGGTMPTTSGLGVRGGLLARDVREARAEAGLAGGGSGTFTLVVLDYDYA
ncbi:MAG TPA: hypothetical protein VFQ85_13445 [Mycobacteriales bacterium]|jgi:hypothetical protein|nr:hypothetical protein [Mycobacteriales bacterium]